VVLAAAFLLVQKSCEEGNQEGRGLAGPGLRLSRHVLAGEGQRERFFLYRCAVGETGLLDPPEDLRRNLQF